MLIDTQGVFIDRAVSTVVADGRKNGLVKALVRIASMNPEVKTVIREAAKAEILGRSREHRG